MKYGLPYKGSKNKLAERIVRLLPRADHLIDLFCGGCAVSHAALVRGKYSHVHINDLNWMCPQLFVDALNGKYQGEHRWISREDFLRLRDTDPYVAFVWSFGNNLRDYLYSRDIEPLKRAIHYAIYFSDYQPASDLGLDLSFIDPISDPQRRYLAVKHWFAKGGAKPSTHCRRASAAPTRSHQNSSTSTANVGCRSSKKKKIQNGRALQRRTAGQNAADCSQPRAYRSSAESSALTLSLSLSQSSMDYAEVEIPPHSVIYCDIPYEGTNVYNGAEQFDYERFYAWCERQTEPVFISSYDMPRDRFDCIQEFTHRSTLSASANNQVTERIFVPRHQKERGNIIHEISLFPE